MVSKIGFTCGTWDLLHAGHVMFLKNCKQHCDHLIVGLQTDPTIDRIEKNRPIQSIYERIIQLEGCHYVDEIVPYDTERSLIDVLSTIHVNVRFVGSDYLHKKLTGLDVCQNRDINIHYIERAHNWSSSELRERIINASKVYVPKTNESGIF